MGFHAGGDLAIGGGLIKFVPRNKTLVKDFRIGYEEKCPKSHCRNLSDSGIITRLFVWSSLMGRLDLVLGLYICQTCLSPTSPLNPVDGNATAEDVNCGAQERAIGQ